MGKAGIGAAGLAVLLLARPADAQVGGYRFPDPTVLVGPGASIGVRVRELSPEELGRANVQYGVAIEEVEQDTPAERAGLKVGDLVVEFDGERVRSVRSLARLVSETPPDRVVKTTFVRDGQRQTVDITPERRADRLARDFTQIVPRTFPELRVQPRAPRVLPPVPRFDVVPPQRRLGVTLSTVDGQLADFFGVTAGVLVSAVDGDSAAARAGLRAGDVITAVNGRPVRRPADVVDAVGSASSGASVQLTIVRDRNEMTVDVMLPNPAGVPVPGAAPIPDAGRIPV